VKTTDTLSWRATANDLEYVAGQHNDALLILDELREVDPKEVTAGDFIKPSRKNRRPKRRWKRGQK
jgi:uncharacterized protein (DUF927 family)